MTALLLLLPLVLDESAAAARLAELRHDFAARPKAASMAALRQLGDDAPDTAAGARALDWLGDLERGEHHAGRARDAYGRAYRSRDPLAHRLAARGLGDLAMDDHAYVAAHRLYVEARVGAEGVLAAELDQKVALSATFHRRAVAEDAAWLLVLATLAFFVARGRPWARPRPGVPTEVLYVVPVYALLIVGCLGRDAAVLHALWMCALWSTALILAAGLAARRAPPSPRARVAHLLLLVAANAALFWAVINRAGIVDKLFMTVGAP